MTTQSLVNIGLDYGLLPDGAKPLTKPMLAYCQWASVACIWEQLYM